MYPPQQQTYIQPQQQQQQPPTVIVQPQYVVNPPASGPTVYVHPQQQPSVIIEERTVVRENPRVIGLNPINLFINFLLDWIWSWSCNGCRCGYWRSNSGGWAP